MKKDLPQGRLSGDRPWCAVLAALRGLHLGFVIASMCLGLFVGGCCQHPVRPATRPINVSIAVPYPDEVLQTMVAPPIGWKPDPLKSTDKSSHRVWLSPTGNTAYGVIYFNLPLPVGVNLAFGGFTRQMKATTGDCTVISKADDPDLPGIRFVADGGLYRIRCNLQVGGFHGWAVYAGSLRARPVVPEELTIAEEARERTRIGIDK